MPIQGGKMLLVVLGLHSTANYFDKMSSVVLHCFSNKISVSNGLFKSCVNQDVLI